LCVSSLHRYPTSVILWVDLVCRSVRLKDKLVMQSHTRVPNPSKPFLNMARHHCSYRKRTQGSSDDLLLFNHLPTSAIRLMPESDCLRYFRNASSVTSSLVLMLAPARLKRAGFPSKAKDPSLRHPPRPQSIGNSSWSFHTESSTSTDNRVSLDSPNHVTPFLSTVGVVNVPSKNRGVQMCQNESASKNS